MMDSIIIAAVAASSFVFQIGRLDDNKQFVETAYNQNHYQSMDQCVNAYAMTIAEVAKKATVTNKTSEGISGTVQLFAERYKCHKVKGEEAQTLPKPTTQAPVKSGIIQVQAQQYYPSQQHQQPYPQQGYQQPRQQGYQPNPYAGVTPGYTDSSVPVPLPQVRPVQDYREIAYAPQTRLYYIQERVNVHGRQSTRIHSPGYPTVPVCQQALKDYFKIAENEIRNQYKLYDRTRNGYNHSEQQIRELNRKRQYMSCVVL